MFVNFSKKRTILNGKNLNHFIERSFEEQKNSQSVHHLNIEENKEVITKTIKGKSTESNEHLFVCTIKDQNDFLKMATVCEYLGNDIYFCLINEGSNKIHKTDEWMEQDFI